jgi:hypothetical protein
MSPLSSSISSKFDHTHNTIESPKKTISNEANSVDVLIQNETPRSIKEEDKIDSSRIGKLEQDLLNYNKINGITLETSAYKTTLRCLILKGMQDLDSFSVLNLSTLATKMWDVNRTKESLRECFQSTSWDLDSKKIVGDKNSKTIKALEDFACEYSEFLDLSVESIVKLSVSFKPSNSCVQLVMQYSAVLPTSDSSVKECMSRAFLNWITVQKEMSPELLQSMLTHWRTLQKPTEIGWKSLIELPGITKAQSIELNKFKDAYESLAFLYINAPIGLFLTGVERPNLSKLQLAPQYYNLFEKSYNSLMENGKVWRTSFKNIYDDSVAKTQEFHEEKMRKTKSKAGVFLISPNKHQCQKMVNQEFSSTIQEQNKFARAFEFLAKMNNLRKFPVVGILKSEQPPFSMVAYILKNYFSWNYTASANLEFQISILLLGTEVCESAQNSGTLDQTLEKSNKSTRDLANQMDFGVARKGMTETNELMQNFRDLSQHLSNQLTLFTSSIDPSDEKVEEKGLGIAGDKSPKEMSHVYAEWIDSEEIQTLPAPKLLSRAEKRKKQKAKKQASALKEKKAKDNLDKSEAPVTNIQLPVTQVESQAELEARLHSLRIKETLNELEQLLIKLGSGSSDLLPKVLKKMNLSAVLINESIQTSFSTTYKELDPNFEKVNEIADHFFLITQGVGLFLQSLLGGKWQQLEICAQTYFVDLHVILENRLKLSILKNRKALIESSKNKGAITRQINTALKKHRLLDLVPYCEQEILTGHREFLEKHRDITFWSRYTSQSEASQQGAMPSLLKLLLEMGQLEPKKYLSQSANVKLVMAEIVASLKGAITFVVDPELFQEMQMGLFLNCIEKLGEYCLKQVEPFATKQSKEEEQLEQHSKMLKQTLDDCFSLVRRPNGDNPVPTIKEVNCFLNRLNAAFHMIHSPLFNSDENQFWIQRNLLNIDKAFEHLFHAMGRLSGKGAFYPSQHLLKEAIESLEGVVGWSIAVNESTLLNQINIGNCFHYLHQYRSDPQNPKEPLRVHTTLRTLFQFSKGKVKGEDEDGFIVQDSDAISAGDFLKDVPNIVNLTLPILEKQLTILMKLMTSTHKLTLTLESRA